MVGKRSRVTKDTAKVFPFYIVTTPEPLTSYHTNRCAIAHCAVIHTIKGGSVRALAFLVDVFFLHMQAF